MSVETVPLGDLRNGIEILLNKRDGVEYVQQLLDEANRQFGEGYPHISNFWEGYDKITNAGGYQLTGVASNGGTVQGDLYADGALPGTVYITPYYAIDRIVSPAETASVQGRYAYTALHETFHLARQGGYNDQQMARTACFLAGVPPPEYSDLDVFSWSRRFDDFLKQHCPRE